jgi:hypothetical protein
MLQRVRAFGGEGIETQEEIDDGFQPPPLIRPACPTSLFPAPYTPSQRPRTPARSSL